MRAIINEKLWALIAKWTALLESVEAESQLQREHTKILIFFHGESLAHTIRPLILGRALREKKYDVVFAGGGKYSEKIAADGFAVHEAECISQSYIDEYIADRGYDYYTREWIERCTTAERRVIRALHPDLIVADFRPTLRITAAAEGLDIAWIDAAYNQPGYPHVIQLPEWFPSSFKSIDDYINQHVQKPKPHRSIYLMADVPEFHPSPPGAQPGQYFYIGPLIEDTPASEIIPPALSDGWDTELPLIYFNCGSTGLGTEYLTPLLHRFAELPYRLLVTTAGRCAVSVPTPNIRVVDYLPAAQIMSQADLFIGIGGIGSIYHALRQGVPVIGAPEHLDQEYHLNRIEQLGLGLKLRRRQFLQPDCVVDAVCRLFIQRAAYVQRCAEFSRHVKKWQGGAVAADAIDQLFISDLARQHIHSDFAVSEAEFIRHVYPTIPEGFTQEDVRKILADACARGIPHERREGQLWFDHVESWNWMYDHEPKFFEIDYQEREIMRRHFFSIKDGTLVPERARQRYRFTYTYMIYPGGLDADRPMWIFLPYPRQSENQTDIRLHGCDPLDLNDHFLPTTGFFYAYPFKHEKGRQTPYTFSYSCKLTVKVQSMAELNPAQELTARERTRYTEVPPGTGESIIVRNFVAEIGIEPSDDDLEKARKIYRRLATTKHFKKTKDVCQCHNCSTKSVLLDDGGHCLTISRTFITLCRLAGIPAREVTGSLAVKPIGSGRFELSIYDVSPFMHTWIEFHTRGLGWVPVDFHSIALGEIAMTKDNVSDPLLHQRVQDNSDAFVNYYFGNMDCHRIVCSDATKKIPQLVVREETGNTAIGNFARPERVREESHLLFECIEEESR